MKRTLYFTAVGSLTLAGLPAQTPQPARGALETAFAQQAESLSGGRGVGGGRGLATPLPRAEKGKPFSATVTTQSVQTLADGTRVTQATTTAMYRDSEGRVRTETMQQSPGSSPQVTSVTIRDTVGGVTYLLDPVRKTARRGIAISSVGLPGTSAGGFAAPAPGARGGRGGGVGAGSGSGEGAGARGGRGGGGAPAPADAIERLIAQIPGRNPNETTDELGVQIVNGVPARGTRVTTVVPVGAIGNDREFRSVSERWYSDELNMLVKSVSTDPRFGTTTYEMTNIVRAAPDAALFQPPADYTVLDGAGGRGQ